MKKILIAIFIALPLVCVNATADETLLAGLQKSSSVIELSDQELSTIQGSSRYRNRGGCRWCSQTNSAYVTQMNIALGGRGRGRGVNQSNSSNITQRNQ